MGWWHSFAFTITEEQLAKLRVLYRAPDTLALFGIPYDMRPGQQPYDIERSIREHQTMYLRCLGAGMLQAKWRAWPPTDWLWLGQPGWWGCMDESGIARVRAFLERRKADVPGGPCEWVQLFP